MSRKITYQTGQHGLTFRFPATRRGLFGLGRIAEAVSTDEWVGSDNADLALAIAALRAYEDQHPGNVVESDTDIVASHSAVAALNDVCARAMGLPDTPPYVLRVSTLGSMSHDDFTVRAKWFDGGSSVAAKRTGAILHTSANDFRISQPTYGVLAAIDRFVELPTSEAADRWHLIASIKAAMSGTVDADVLWPDSGGKPSEIELEEFLQGITIYPAKQLSLRLYRDADGSIDFDPILFSDDAQERARAGDQISEKDGVLPDEFLEQFLTNSSVGFRHFEGAKGTYLLKSGHFLVIDPALVPALKVVRQQQRNEEAAARKAFAANPVKAISEYLKSQRPPNVEPDSLTSAETDEAIEKATSELFVETIEYSDRVIGLGVWQPPLLPYVEKASNPWEPETFGIRIAGQYVPLKPEEIPGLQKAVAKAIAKGEPSVNFKGATIPANEQTKVVVDQLIGMMKPAGDKPPSTPEGEERLQYALLVKQNFEEETFRPKHEPRLSGQSFVVPSTVTTALLKHQTVGFRWACLSYAAGYPGVLNADDQGLGKTLQTIAFLAWLRVHLKSLPPKEQRPILVVAPTSLLRNWVQEV